eukprot:PLAT12819.1.p1 GENE.PLAT12819.1~~PLAT12819.1.p1  ORF type:complete len:507 (+),score=232.37 PLAT12819.1:59-1522(+)
MRNLSAAVAAAIWLLLAVCSAQGSQPLAAEEKTMWENLLRWLKLEGASVDNAPALAYGSRGRGLFLPASNPEKMYVSIPVTALLRLDNVRDSGKAGKQLGQWVDEREASATPPERPRAAQMANTAVLAAELLRERAGIGSGRWSAYVDSLPVQTPLVTSLPADLLSLLQKASPEVNDALQQKFTVSATLIEEMKLLAADLPTLLPAEIATADAMQWAADMIISRSFALGSRGLPTLVPLGDMINHEPGAPEMGGEGDAVIIDGSAAGGDGELLAGYAGASDGCSAHLLAHFGFSLPSHDDAQCVTLHMVIAGKQQASLIESLMHNMSLTLPDAFTLLPSAPLPPALLQKMRIAFVTHEEYDRIDRVPRGAVLSIRNEQQVIRQLLSWATSQQSIRSQSMNALSAAAATTLQQLSAHAQEAEARARPDLPALAAFFQQLPSVVDGQLRTLAAAVEALQDRWEWLLQADDEQLFSGAAQQPQCSDGVCE